MEGSSGSATKTQQQSKRSEDDKEFEIPCLKSITPDYLRLGPGLGPIPNKVVIGWENNMDGDKTMPISLKTIGSAGYRDPMKYEVCIGAFNR